jgi:hypothetical protein
MACSLVCISCDEKPSASEEKGSPTPKSERAAEPEEGEREPEKSETQTPDDKRSSVDAETDQEGTQVSIEDMKIGPEGLDVLAKTDDGAISSVRRQLGGLGVSESKREYAGSVMPLYLVEKDGETLVRIHPSHGNVGSIYVVSPKIEGPEKTRVGMPYADIVEMVGDLQCVRGAESLAGKLMCYNKELGLHLQYVFDGTQVDSNIEEPTAQHMKGLEVQSIRSW